MGPLSGTNEAANTVFARLSWCFTTFLPYINGGKLGRTAEQIPADYGQSSNTAGKIRPGLARSVGWPHRDCPGYAGSVQAVD